MKHAGSRRSHSVVLHATLIAAGIVVIVPFLWLIASSFKTNEAFFTSLFLPLGDGMLGVAWDALTFSNFRRVLGELGFGGNLLNSIFLSSVTSVLATVCAAAGGFALAHYSFGGKRIITLLIVLMLTIPPQLLLAPTYQLLYSMGLLDTFSGLIIPAIAPAFGLFLFRQASISSVPRQLLEAARIDGCGELRTFFVIALPLVRPMMGAFLLITFLGTWNNFLSPQVVLQSESKFPLSVAIAQLRDVYYQEYGLMMAATLISIAPIMVLFLFMQREFISGLTAGAVKG